jgi:hypothetical protein
MCLTRCIGAGLESAKPDRRFRKSRRHDRRVARTVTEDERRQVGEQINGNNTVVLRFGRRWQLGVRLAF